jgi:hypothetical protein
MKWILYILIIFTATAFRSNGDNMRVVTVSKESKITIQGSSNVNTFDLDIKEYTGRDTLVMIQRPNSLPITFIKGLLHVAVNDFKNSNPFLTKDFKKVVKANSYPHIVMNFRNMNIYPCNNGQKLPGVAEVEINVAGKSKIFKINVLACRSNEIVYLHGNTKINFSDFGLSAPNKVFGFINVNDQLEVNFNLALRELTRA